MAATEESIASALERDRVIDITTYGRKSGAPRRIEIWFHNVDGVVYLTGLPGRRDWVANLTANPGFVFHLKESVTADLQATAHPVSDRAEQTSVLTEILARLGRSGDLDAWLSDSPLVRVQFANQPES